MKTLHSQNQNHQPRNLKFTEIPLQEEQGTILILTRAHPERGMILTLIPVLLEDMTQILTRVLLESVEQPRIQTRVLLESVEQPQIQTRVLQEKVEQLLLIQTKAHLEKRIQQIPTEISVQSELVKR